MSETRPRCVEGQSDHWAGFCSRKPSGEDGLCTQHRKIREKRAARNVVWNAHDRQRRFVSEWREAHPDDVYGDTWECPLCRKVIQAQENQGGHNAMVMEMRTKHQRFHGPDWLAYQQAGQPKEGDGR